MKKLLLFLFIIPLIAHGQEIVWDGSIDQLPIGSMVEILEDPSQSLSLEQVTSEEVKRQFKTSSQNILSLGYTESHFWLHVAINNVTNHNTILELAQAGLPLANLYYTLNDSIAELVKAGYQIPVHNKSYHSSYQAFALPPGKTECYIRLVSNSEPIPVNLYSEKAFEKASTAKVMGYGIYLGLMIFVVLNNFFLFISLRRKLFLFYSLLVLIYISYSAAVIDGFIVYFIPHVNLLFFYTTIPAIGIVMQTSYCLVFLKAKSYVPKVNKIVIGIVIYFAIWMLIKFFLPLPLVLIVNTINALLSFFIMSMVGIMVGKKGNKMGYYFAIAYFIYFLLVVMQAIYINTGRPEYIGGLSFVAYATLFEAFILSFLLSRRFRWERKEIETEKFEAQQKVIEKTLENKKIIQNQNLELEKEVAERTKQLKEINEELLATNEQLIDLNREKDGLMHVVAHDLRSPLSTIINFVELIEHEAPNSDAQKEHLRVIDHVVQDGMYLIDDLLDLHSFNSGNAKARLELINIEEYMNSWLKKFDKELNKKNQTAQLTFGITNSEFTTDPFLLTRILNNLLSNAIKFSDKEKNIDIHVTETANDFSFAVKDEGPGISPEDQEKMFKLFQKLSARPTNGERSNGLGLSIVQALTNKLGGKVKVNSQSGKGAEFIIQLPKT
ncbi:sensor histidine kinase [Carboxylicivirga linearis]|uniref:histidine kinase n=1 Tax=Carboxylicivirga linearis TaxID=1628157 RepID=A0ABS5JWD5_9BACT|nr:sensor histidine kinase [Carboxylicivirga linearis]MBS2099225.1 sensor histidine kinase [Carboxylicivirga linearis]